MTSMKAITAFQLAYAALAYLGTLYCLPTLACQKQMRGMKTPMRLLFCIVFGNFWIINAVLLVFTLRFSNIFSLIASTWGLAIALWFYQNRKTAVPFLKRQYTALIWLMKGELKGMLYARKGLAAGVKSFGGIGRRAMKGIVPRVLELALIGFITAFNVWMFSYQTFTNQGFGVPDMPVHTYWIDSMINGNIFCDGVYPFGFHCAVYYIVKVFGIDLVYLMRVFGPIQTALAFFTIYLFLRTICRSRFAPIAAYIVLCITPIVTNGYSFMRSQFALPQEFGMIFIMPIGAFIAEYMRRYLDGEENPNICLYMFGAAFSLTIAVHFYVTFLAAMMCAAACVAYFPVIFKPKLFGRIVLCGVISVMVAIAPLAIAFATGTELQPSLMWALSIMNIGVKDEEEAETAEEEEAVEEEEPVAEEDDAEAEVDNGEGTLEPKPVENAGIVAKLKAAPAKWYYFLSNVSAKKWQKLDVLLLFLITACGGIGLLFKKLRRHAQSWLLVAGYFYFTCFLGCMHSLGLPSLLEGYRIMPFLSFGVCLVYAYPFELLCLMPKTRKFFDSVVALALCFFLGISFAKPELGLKKGMNYFYYLQHSGDITVVYDLISKYPDQKWTLLSTVSELYQIYSQHGWHYEISDFVRKQRRWNERKTLTIPTQYVFILIEKKVFQYSDLTRVGKLPEMMDVELDMAAEELTIVEGSNSVYNSRNSRGKLMAHMMAWVEAFKEKYPNELELYYEDEFVICYRVIQNVYSLYNFSLDYGYNSAN